MLWLNRFNITRSSIIRNPYLLFFPFLVSYIIWVFISKTDGTAGDEARYLGFAQNLIHGFYSPSTPNIDLTNGPGYPIILVPFLMLKLPLISITLMNAVFYYFSIILLFYALKEIVSNGLAIAFSLVWASYYLAFQCIPMIFTETFTYLLVATLIFSIIRAYKPTNPSIVNKYILLAGFIFGYIVLTRIIFGYVLLIMLVGSVLFWTINKNNLNYRKGVVILLLAFATTIPYLVYTYQITGRAFYWGYGGSNLYWMSNTDNNEYGNWFPDKTMDSESEFFAYYTPGCRDSITLHHGKELKEIHKLKGIEQDDAYRQIAIMNIKKHPLKYMRNIIYNAGRFIFQYPFSNAISRPKVLMVFPINGILLTFILFSLIPTLINWRKIIFPLRFLLIIVLLYVGGSLLVSVFLRMFTIVVPILLIWIAYILQNTMIINLKFNKSFK